MNRREFIKSSASVAAGVTAPAVLSPAKAQARNAGIAFPAEGGSGLDRRAQHMMGQKIILIGLRLRLEMRPHGIRVVTIAPGYIDTPMTSNNRFPMPFLMTSARASRIIRRGLTRNKARIAFPLGTKAAVWLGSVLPGSWTARLLGA